MLLTVPPIRDSVLGLSGFGASKSATSVGSARPPPPMVFVTGRGAGATRASPLLTVGSAVPASGEGRGLVTVAPAPFGVLPTVCTVDCSMCVPGAGETEVPEGCCATAKPKNKNDATTTKEVKRNMSLLKEAQDLCTRLTDGQQLCISKSWMRNGFSG